jgi:hypothetical protein
VKILVTTGYGGTFRHAQGKHCSIRSYVLQAHFWSVNMKIKRLLFTQILQIDKTHHLTSLR